MNYPFSWNSRAFLSDKIFIASWRDFYFEEIFHSMLFNGFFERLQEDPLIFKENGIAISLSVLCRNDISMSYPFSNEIKKSVIGNIWTLWNYPMYQNLTNFKITVCLHLLLDSRHNTRQWICKNLSFLHILRFIEISFLFDMFKRNLYAIFSTNLLYCGNFLDLLFFSHCL